MQSRRMHAVIVRDEDFWGHDPTVIPAFGYEFYAPTRSQNNRSTH
jgi:hypothetical protein